MRSPWIFILLTAFLVVLPACGTAAIPAPTVTPTLTPVPPTSTPWPTPVRIGAYMGKDIPICDEVELLSEDFGFHWPGLETWRGNLEKMEFHRCKNDFEQLAALYREKMVAPPYNWIEVAWVEDVENTEGTLGEFYHMVYESWIYLWFIPDSSGSQTSYLVAGWLQGDIPLDMPCH